MRTATTSAHALLRLIDEGDFTSAARAMVRRGITLDHLGTDRQRAVRAEIFRDNEGGCSHTLWPAWWTTPGDYTSLKYRDRAAAHGALTWVVWGSAGYTPHLMWRGLRVETHWRNTAPLAGALRSRLVTVWDAARRWMAHAHPSLTRQLAIDAEHVEDQLLTGIDGPCIKALLGVLKRLTPRTFGFDEDAGVTERCLRWLVTGEVTS